MNRDVKISIIVPIYNVSNYLRNCLDSLVNQTLTEIEIICVDDGSSDDSPKIIKEYAQSDQRVKSVFLKRNSGICVARKSGVLRAAGSYIMFCDADDALSPNACDEIWAVVQKHPVEILQFATKIELQNGQSRDSYNELQKILQPYAGSYSGDICSACFEEHKFGYTLWNKAYATEFCKKAFNLVSDTHIVVAEDLYIFFILSYLAKSYFGITKTLYIYNYGLGITQKSFLDIQRFKKQVDAVNIVTLLHDFLTKQSSEEKYFQYLKDIKLRITDDSLYQWKNWLTLSQTSEGYQYLCDKFGVSAVISEMARLYWDDQEGLLKRLPLKRCGVYKGKKVKRIGVYYHRLRNGGAEKVISELLVVWKQLGYELILFTDEEPTSEDYPIPEEISRRVLPSYQKAIASNYKRRALYWESVIRELDIDTILYNSSTCHILLWDVCLLKGLGCNLIIQTHSMFAGAMWYSPIYASYLPLIFRLVDCAVSLSRVDVAFWKNYCPTYYIQNPITLVQEEEMATLDSHNILWVGRLAEEKQPFAILEAFRLVLDEITDATLTILGDGDEPEWKERLEKRANELGIEKQVEFTGFQLNVAPFYKKAAVLAFTSMCEAAPLVLSESKSYGIPIVMFDLPNVEFVRDSRGVVKVAQNDILALSNAISLLLHDKNKRLKMGIEARASIVKFAQFDVANMWKGLFSDIEKGLNYCCDENISIMLDLLLENVNRGIKLLTATPSYHNNCESCKSAHEEILQRHEEVINRHNDSINHQWEIQKWHEERLKRLEAQRPLWRKVLGYLKRQIKKYKRNL